MKTKLTLGPVEIITILLVVLKLTSIISWTWLQVLAPTIFMFVLGFAEGILDVINEYRKNKDA